MDKKRKKTSIETAADDELDIFDELDSLSLPEEEGEALTDNSKKPQARPDLKAPVAVKQTEPSLKTEKHESHKTPDAAPQTVSKAEPKSESKPGSTIGDEFADIAPDVPVNLVAVIGKTMTNVGELLKLKQGQIVDLGRAPNEIVDVVANGRLIAKGELVDVDGKLGVRILKMVK